MKFAIRDDDLNYYFDYDYLSNHLNDIWEICPISMAIVPYIKGDWPKFVYDNEIRGPGLIDEAILRQITNDNKIYPIHKNKKLVDFIRNKVEEKKVYLLFHSIHHRNEDPIIPQLENNYGIGAEFYTTRDLSLPLKEAIRYVENTFNQKIEIMSFPQECYSKKGLKAALSNNLALCAPFPSIKNLETLKLFGLVDYYKYLIFSLFNELPIKYPYPIVNKELKIVTSYSINLGLEKIKEIIDLLHRIDGTFILRLHSYGFDFRMKDCSMTYGECARQIVEYATKKDGVQFLNLHQILLNGSKF